MNEDIHQIKLLTLINVNYIFVKEANFKRNNLLTKFFKMVSFSFNLFKAFIFGRINFKNTHIVYSSSPDLFTSLIAHFIAKMK